MNLSRIVVFLSLWSMVLSAQSQTSKAEAPAIKPLHFPKVEETTVKLDRIQKLSEELKARPISSPSHRLIEGDVIEVKVYQEDELTTRARLDGDGSISIPLLGLIKVGGRTVDQAQSLIRDRLEEDYLHHPQVSLVVLEFAKKRFSVVGEVNQPGFYLFPEGERMTLLQAVAMAGGLTPFARSGKVTIKRIQDGKESVLEANVKAMSKKQKTPMIDVRPGDAILVHQSLF